MLSEFMINECSCEWCEDEGYINIRYGYNVPSNRILVCEKFKNLTLKKCLNLVSSSGWNLEHLVLLNLNSIPEICLAAVKENGYALQYIDKRILSDEILLAAIKENGKAIQFVDSKKQSHALRLAAVKQTEGALLYIENPTFEICDASVSKYPDTYRYVDSCDMRKKVYISMQNKLANQIHAVPKCATDIILSYMIDQP